MRTSDVLDERERTGSVGYRLSEGTSEMGGSRSARGDSRPKGTYFIRVGLGWSVDFVMTNSRFLTEPIFFPFWSFLEVFLDAMWFLLSANYWSSCTDCGIAA